MYYTDTDEAAVRQSWRLGALAGRTGRCRILLCVSLAGPTDAGLGFSCHVFIERPNPGLLHFVVAEAIPYFVVGGT